MEKHQEWPAPAEMEGHFDLLITADRNMFAKRNLSGRNICILVLPTNRRIDIMQMAERIVDVVNGMTTGMYVVVEKTGEVHKRSFSKPDGRL